MGMVRDPGIFAPPPHAHTRTATANLASGARLSLSGFLTVEETRFRALNDEAFLELRRKGWLSAIYAQIQSTLNWTRLADLAEAAGAAAA